MDKEVILGRRRKKKYYYFYHIYPSRECGRVSKEGRSSRRRDDDYGRYSSSNSNHYSRYGWLLILNDSMSI